MVMTMSTTWTTRAMPRASANRVNRLRQVGAGVASISGINRTRLAITHSAGIPCGGSGVGNLSKFSCLKKIPVG